MREEKIKKDIEDKLKELQSGDIVEMITENNDNFFAILVGDYERGEFKFYDVYGLLGYNLAGEPWGADFPSRPAIVDIRVIPREKVLKFLNENKELFKKAEEE